MARGLWGGFLSWTARQRALNLWDVTAKMREKRCRKELSSSRLLRDMNSWAVLWVICFGCWAVLCSQECCTAPWEKPSHLWISQGFKFMGRAISRKTRCLSVFSHFLPPLSSWDEPAWEAVAAITGFFSFSFCRSFKWRSRLNFSFTGFPRSRQMKRNTWACSPSSWARWFPPSLELVFYIDQTARATNLSAEVWRCITLMSTGLYLR